VSSFDDTTDTISSIKRDTIVNKDTIAPIQAPKEETDEEELRKIEREFLSSKLIRKVNSDELSSDPIVKSQDIIIEWLDSIKVKKINSKRYNVYIFDFFLNRYDSVQLKVAKKKDKYIIDDIIF